MVFRRTASTRSKRRKRLTAALLLTGTSVAAIPSASANHNPDAPDPVAQCHTVARAVTNNNGNPEYDYAISWDQANGVDGSPGGYIIQRDYLGQGNYSWRKLAGPTGPTTWYDDLTGNAGNTPSIYQIKTKNSDSVLGHETTCTTVATPSTPTVTNSNNGSGTITLQWGSVDGATDYVLTQTLGNNAPTSQTLTANAGATQTWSTTGLAPGDYTFSVAAAITGLANNALSYTNTTSDSGSAAVTLTDVEQPLPPTGLDFTTGPNQISWNASTDNVAVTGYNIYDNATGVVVYSTSGPVTTWDLTGLAPGTYNLYVKALDAAGGESWRSNIEQATTTDIQAPTTPQSLTASNLAVTGFSLGWSASSDNVGVTGYEITVNGSTTTVTGTSMSVTGLDPDTAYPVSVVAVDAEGNTSAAAVLTVSTIVDGVRPESPTGFEAVIDAAADDSINMTWDATTDNVAVTSYNIYDDPNNTPSLPADDVLVANFVGTSGSVTNQADGTYNLYVKALDGSGNESYRSNIESVAVATADIQAPTTPQSLTASNLAVTGFSLGWSASSDNVGVTGYEITVNGSTTTVTGTSMSVTGLDPDTAYPVSVVAVDAEGNTSAAAVLTVSTIVDGVRPATPSGFALTVDGNGDPVSVSWIATTDNVAVSGYNVYDILTGDLVHNTNAATLSWDLASLGSGSYELYVKAFDATGNLSWRSGTKQVVVGGAGSSEKYATQEVGGRWELILAADEGQNSPTIQRIKSIGVRTDLNGGPDAVTSSMLDNVKTQGFNTIRVTIHWEDFQKSQNGALDTTLKSDLDQLIVRAGSAGLGVILDPIHLGGGQENGFWIPDWAWDVAWANPANGPTNFADPKTEQHPDDSTEVLMWNPANNDDLGLAYLKLILNEYKDNDTVVGIELMNEPHPIDGNAWNNTSIIADLQADWVQELRTIDADKLLIVTGYYGGYLADKTKFEAAFTDANGDSDWDNVVFTAHSYYSGIGITGDIDADDDGYGDVNISPQTWLRGSKTGTRVEGYETRGCYGVAGTLPDPSFGQFSCATPNTATRAIAVGNLVEGFEAQDDVAQASNMPLFLGEFGSHPIRQVNGNYYGWGSADLMVCDQIKALRQINGTNEVSYSVWDLNTGGFGIYDTGTNDWNDLGDQFADTSCTG